MFVGANVEREVGAARDSVQVYAKELGLGPGLVVGV
jgi:hypothetical protein